MTSSSTGSPPEIIPEARSEGISVPIENDSGSDVNIENYEEQVVGEVEKAESESEGDVTREDDNGGEIHIGMEIVDDDSNAKKRKADETDSFGGESEREEDVDEQTTGDKQSSYISNGMVDFRVDRMKRNLICMNCKGYFRDPYTIAECLHTFCKSCLFLRFHSGLRRCPTCNISLDPDPFKAVLSDRTLQDLLDKLFPQLKAIDEENEQKFYRKRGIELKESSTLDYSLTQSNAYNSGASASASYSTRPYREKRSQKARYDFKAPVSNEIVFKLMPDDNKNPMDCLRKPILRTSGQLKVQQLKKYLIEKLKLDVNSSPTIDVLCNGDPLGEELSLKFISRTRWHHPNQNLCLHYRFGEDGTY